MTYLHTQELLMSVLTIYRFDNKANVERTQNFYLPMMSIATMQYLQGVDVDNS